MVYSEEFEIRDCQLSLTKHDNLELLLDDYLTLNEMISDYEKDKRPIEKKIINLKHKVSLIDGAIHEIKKEFWMKHLKDLLPISKMTYFIYGKFSAIEGVIRKLAFKKEEEK